ncbi:DPM3 mannosyltransferase, partial [Balaeniceps rex]|nr:DPM3 mannosyltransferase [Balaeniceps rex]
PVGAGGVGAGRGSVRLSRPLSPQAAMTKLGQWLCGLALLGSAWAALALAPPGLQLPAPYRQALLPLPVYLLVAFGCYSLATVGYRLATFNDCEEAATELQEHISAARADLRRRGLRF